MVSSGNEFSNLNRSSYSAKKNKNFLMFLRRPYDDHGICRRSVSVDSGCAIYLFSGRGYY